MLSNLHVKNMALIEEIDISFEKGLNVITGETGAGKSLLLGSVDLALGGKFSQAMLRKGAENALVELVFDVEEDAAENLEKIGYPPEDGQIIISRKIQGGRSSARVNGESCTTSTLRQIAQELITIHGQRENQVLLKNEKQLEMLDEFGKEEIKKHVEKVSSDYEIYKKAQKRIEEYSLDEEARLREISMLSYEVKEIEDAALADGEEEQLEQKYKRMKESGKILDALQKTHENTGYEHGAGDLIGRALQEISQVSGLDVNLKEIEDSLSDIESILEDVNRQAADYLDEFNFSEQEFMELEERLDKIHHIQAKYGNSLEKIRSYKEKAEERLAFLENYELEREKAEKERNSAMQVLEKSCEELSNIRKKTAKEFSFAIQRQLEELNFAQALIDIEFKRTSTYKRNGFDEIEIYISTNPGEPLRALEKVASGGELSRIMLAIRNILADEKNTQTLIFDEIDTGISGRTAQKVSEKMASISIGHQILCVTHLAQIAAMADTHYIIEKKFSENTTVTQVRRLTKEEEIKEIARILGGAKITQAVYSNAAEMKQFAEKYKKDII